MGGHPLQGQVTVIQGCGEGELGGDAIIHRNNRQAQLTDELHTASVILLGLTHHVAAAVQPQYGPGWGSEGFRLVDAQP